MSDYQKQLANAEARLKKLVEGRPKFHRAWDDTFAIFHEDPAAYHDAHAKLLAHDIEKNKVWDEVAELRKFIAEEKLKKFERVQDVFDAGYAWPHYSIETKTRAWRYKDHVYNTDRLVPVEKILFNGEVIDVLPHKEKK